MPTPSSTPLHVSVSASVSFSNFQILIFCCSTCCATFYKKNEIQFIFGLIAAVPINAKGICGSIHVANPIDACSSLQNAKAKIALGVGNDDDDSKMRFVLAIRGNCSFEMKVRIAQDAGFQAVIVYNDQDNNSLVSSNFLSSFGFISIQCFYC